MAQAAALASLEPPAEAQLLARVADLVAERDRVHDELRDLGYDVPPTQANFVWLPLGDATTEWAAGCEERGVIVRAFAGSGARVTIGTPEENDRFLAAAAAHSTGPLTGAGRHRPARCGGQQQRARRPRAPAASSEERQDRAERGRQPAGGGA